MRGQCPQLSGCPVGDSGTHVLRWQIRNHFSNMKIQCVCVYAACMCVHMYVVCVYVQCAHVCVHVCVCWLNSATPISTSGLVQSFSPSVHMSFCAYSPRLYSQGRVARHSRFLWRSGPGQLPALHPRTL